MTVVEFVNEHFTALWLLSLILGHAAIDVLSTWALGRRDRDD